MANRYTYAQCTQKPSAVDNNDKCWNSRHFSVICYVSAVTFTLDVLISKYNEFISVHQSVNMRCKFDVKFPQTVSKTSCLITHGRPDRPTVNKTPPWRYTQKYTYVVDKLVQCSQVDKHSDQSRDDTADQLDSDIVVDIRRHSYRVYTLYSTIHNSSSTVNIYTGTKTAGSVAGPIHSMKTTDPAISSDIHVLLHRRRSVHKLHCKNISDVFRNNSRKHCRIFMIFGRNITKKSKQSKDAIFFHLTELMLLHYLAKLKTRKMYFSHKCFMLIFH